MTNALVSDSVHEMLRHREKYMGMFRRYVAVTKHGEKVSVHQLLRKDVSGLNTEVPRVFKEFRKEAPTLTKYVAYYLAHAIANRPLLVNHKYDIIDEEAYVVLLHFLASDSVDRSEAKDFERVYPSTYQADSFWEQFDYYRLMDHNVIWRFAEFVKQPLFKYYDCFSRRGSGLPDFRVASIRGRSRLKKEWPQIWDELSLGR